MGERTFVTACVSVYRDRGGLEGGAARALSECRERAGAGARDLRVEAFTAVEGTGHNEILLVMVCSAAAGDGTGEGR